ncbi:MAG: hypothetical protein NZT92_02790 [Abditibacteriales bacterium]|nr:hypothetical protein [Abditibacteriales bacterium]MDW8364806.1 hypothetical protein [Abditibacteriales bacterium]
MTIPAASTPAPPPFRWLVSRRYDLFFFIGSCALTFVFYGVYRVAHHFGFFLRGDSILITYFLFTAFFDHPHIFQTFSRTHYDTDEFNKRRTLYTWGVAAFILVGFVVTALNGEAHLIVFAALFGTWHIIRQHAGLLKAYKILNRDMEPIDNWLDGLTFYVGMFACLLNDYSDVRGPIVIYRDLRAQFPSLPAHFGEMVWSVFLVLLMLFGARQAWRAMEGKPLNVPKLLLMAAALTTHYFVFFATATPFLVAEALETVYHDVQYQGWIMHYQRQRFANVKGVVLKWFAVAMLYGIVVGIIETFGLMRRGWAMWLFVPFTMLVIFHYYVDGLVWRFREYPELRAMLFSRTSSA